MLLSSLAVTLLGRLTPHAAAILVDAAIPDADRRMVLQLGAALLAAACGQTLLPLAQGWALLRQHTTAGAVLQAALWNRLLTLPTTFTCWPVAASSNRAPLRNSPGNQGSLPSSWPVRRARTMHSGKTRQALASMWTDGLSPLLRPHHVMRPGPIAPAHLPMAGRVRRCLI